MSKTRPNSSKSKEPTDIQGLEAVKLRTIINPWDIEIEQIVSNRCVQSGFLQKIKGNMDATAIRCRCKVQAPRNKTAGA